MDDAFAGGVCRCPYCTETVLVPSRRERGGGERPDSPQGRPDAPPADLEAAAAAAAAPAPPAPVRAQHIPVANPVRTQGIVILILILVAMIGGAVAVAVVLLRAPRRQQTPEQQQPDPGIVNPFDPRPAPGGEGTIAGIEIRSPVVYCIDNGPGMRWTFDLISGVTQASIKSLGSKRRFTILLCGRRDSEGNRRRWAMPGGFHSGGPAGKLKADRFLADVDWYDDANLPATIAKALELKAATIVFCGRRTVADPEGLGARAKAKGASIVTIAVTDDDEAAASLAALAEASGGESRRLTRDELDAWLQSTNW